MFRTKPSTISQEFAELQSLFSTNDLAYVLQRRPETISRLKARESFPQPLERWIDDIWFVAWIALRELRRPPDETRFFFISRHPELEGRTPAEVIREGEVDRVVELVRSVPDGGSDDRAERRLGARRRFLERSQTSEGIDLDALEEIHRTGWSGG